jgi:hypothetical protein
MKQAIRALGWATTVLWFFVILFSGTVVYSAMQIRMSFEESPQVTASNGTLTISIPFTISNEGFYDISMLNITTRIRAENETTLSSSSSFIREIPKGSVVNEVHAITVSLEDIATKNLTYLLFNDADLNMDMLVALTYADTIPLKILSNLTMPWGAPLSNLTIGEISVSLQPPYRVNVPLSFENHAFFSLNGTIRLEIVDSFGNLIGSGAADIFVPAGYSYDETIAVTITDIPTNVAEVRLYFDTSIFSFGPLVIAVE